MSVTRYHQYAADCVRQAEQEKTADEKGILLNVALAWLRLAQQNEARNEADAPSMAPDPIDPLDIDDGGFDRRPIHHRDWVS